jgi:hypothetical protein
MPVPHWLRTQAQQAVRMCPSLALRLNTRPAGEAPKPAVSQRGGSLKLIASTASEPGLEVSEEWIAELSDVGRQIPRPIT